MRGSHPKGECCIFHRKASKQGLRWEEKKKPPPLFEERRQKRNTTDESKKKLPVFLGEITSNTQTAFFRFGFV
jgi:hypothetical protein